MRITIAVNMCFDGFTTQRLANVKLSFTADAVAMITILKLPKNAENFVVTKLIEAIKSFCVRIN